MRYSELKQLIFCYLLCTIFLAEEMSVRKTVTAWSPKRSRNAIVTGEQEFMNGSSKVSGFLLRIAFYRRFYAGTNSRFPRITPGLPHRGRAVASLSVNVQQNGRSIDRPLHWTIV